MTTIAAFYSDPHFGHAKLIEDGDRPFASVDEMDETLVRNYNACVDAEDTILWVGDCFLGHSPERCRNILTEMSGTKIVVPGNHDGTPTSLAKMGFALVVKEPVFYISNTLCRVSHYPLFRDRTAAREDKFKGRRPVMNPGEVLLHGHTHSTTKMVDNQINLCVEAWEYKPAMRWQIIELIMRYENAHK
jgi:calcineurin-like phosphoesterase family protein